MYKVKALVKKTMGLVLAALVAFGVTAGTTQAFAGSRAATGKPGELKKNDKNAKQLGSQLTTNSSESQSLYEYTKVIGRESYMKDAEIDVYSVKDENGKAAAVITNTYKNTGRFFPQLTGVSEYKATANTGWVFKGWKYKQFLYGMDHGNLHGIFYSFSESSANKGNEYTSGEVISVNRTRGIGETAVLNKRIYNIYANLNPTIKASAGEGGSITPDGTKEVQYGENQKYNFTANKGYVIASLKIDGKEQQNVEHTASGSYEFKAVKSPHTIEVSFVREYTITYTDGVDNEAIFTDQVYKAASGSDTPAFKGSNPSRTDYVFTGWTPTVANKVTRDAKYVAQWKRIQRTVTFKDGDKTHATVKVETGKAINTDALANESMPKDPTKDGFTFKEWNTQRNGQGTKFTGETTVSNDLTVYAVYMKNPVTPLQPQPPVQNQKTVTFNKKDGSLLSTVKVETGKKVAAASMPAAPDEDGFTFKEWNTKQDGTGTPFNVDTVVNEDVTVYAVYAVNPVTPQPQPHNPSEQGGSGSAGGFGYQAENELTAMYRLYNPYSHEHLFTTDANEKDNLVTLGWRFEGAVGKVYMHGEKGGVYRLYNPNTGEHHYTMKENEVAKCVKAGWRNEGVKFFSVLDEDKQTVGMVSMYNPYEKKFYHHYTSDPDEIAKMVKDGWRKEEIKWYAAK